MPPLKILKKYQLNYKTLDNSIPKLILLRRVKNKTKWSWHSGPVRTVLQTLEQVIAFTIWSILSRAWWHTRMTKLQANPIIKKNLQKDKQAH